MISLRKISAIYSKNMKGIVKNPFIIVAPVLVFGLSFLWTMTLPYYADNYDLLGVLNMVLGMNVMLTGITTMCVLIAEEKEKNTLGVLITSTVSGIDFLTAHVLTTATITIAVNVLVFFVVGVDGLAIGDFLIVTSIGTIAAITLGATLGILAKNQAAASTMVTPFIMALLLAPMFFSGTFFVDNIIYYAFTEQMNLAVLELLGDGLNWTRVAILGANIAVFAVLFGFCYRKRGLAV